MEWFATYALAIALSVSPAVADDSPAVEVGFRFDAKSQTYNVRIGEAVVVAKDAALRLTAGDGKELSGQASFSGSVRVEGKGFQAVCERATYDLETWRFEKATIWQVTEGQKYARADGEHMMFNPGTRRLVVSQPQD